MTDWNHFMKNMDEDQCLSVFQLNVQRIRKIKKFRNIRAYVDSMDVKPDVLILTETWITSNTENYHIPGYIAIHCCREYPSAGIALYHKPNLCCEIISYNNGEVSFIHASLFRINEPVNKILITAVYMPTVRYFTILKDWLNNLLPSVAENHIIMGDFNINTLNQNGMTETYTNTLKSHGYSIKNTLPTRPCSRTLIDHVISNFDVIACITLVNDISDHSSQIAILDRLRCERPSHGLHRFFYLILQFMN